MLASDTDKIWDKGYVSGSFDMFHIGHLNLIRRAKERCKYLIVGVLTDEIINRHKKKWPVVTLGDRLEIISALKYVDEVDVTTDALIDKVSAWEKYGFSAMFSGDDHIDDGWAHEEDDLKALGVNLVFFPYTKNVSTTVLQNMILPPKAVASDKPRKMDDGCSYLFPFDKVEKGEKIIIFGAGKVGSEYARQLELLDFCCVVAFADTYAKPGDMFEGKKCLTPNELCENEGLYDRIVIASAKYYEQIMERLRALGIMPERIV